MSTLFTVVSVVVFVLFILNKFSCVSSLKNRRVPKWRLNVKEVIALSYRRNFCICVKKT